VQNLHPVDPLVVFDNQNGGLSTGVGVFPEMDNLDVSDTSGVRGIWGLDLSMADLEVEFFGTQKKSVGYDINNIAGYRPAGFESTGTVERPNIVIPLLTNGTSTNADSANYLIFDDSFSTRLTSQMWGSEISLLSKSYVPGAGGSWQWLGGFRYLNYRESFDFRGTFNNGGIAADTVTQVHSTTNNNMYGPEAGFRAGVNNRWFSLSATPRVAFTLNDYTGITNVASLSGNAAPTGGSGGAVEFTPIVQVSFTGEIHLSPSFSIFGGYDLMWIYRMTRPYDNLVFDSSPGAGGSPVPNIRQQIDLESMYTRGLSFGAVFRY
jgi:hypothetical protein